MLPVLFPINLKAVKSVLILKSCVSDTQNIKSVNVIAMILCLDIYFLVLSQRTRQGRSETAEKSVVTGSKTENRPILQGGNYEIYFQ